MRHRKGKCRKCASSKDLQLYRKYDGGRGRYDELYICMDCKALHHYRYNPFVDYSLHFMKIWDTVKHWSTGVEIYWANRIDYKAELA